MIQSCRRVLLVALVVSSAACGRSSQITEKEVPPARTNPPASITTKEVPAATPTPTASVTTKEIPAVGQRNATKDDNGKTIQLSKGDTLVLTLEERPGTGYHWELDDFDTKVIAKTSDELTATNATARSGYTPPPGSGYSHVWKFRAQAAGTTMLVLHLMPPGQGTTATEEFRLTVKVA